MRASWYVLIACAAALPAVAHAQAGRGEVVDVNDRPVSGVVVQLIDSTTAVVARALTDERGQFMLMAPRAASYQIVALRIGYRPTLSGPYVLQRGETVARRLTLSGTPVALDTVRVTGNSVCGRAVVGDSAAATFAAWEQVRGALTATDLSTGAEGVLTTVLGYRRQLDATGRKTLRQDVAVHTDAVRQPWTSHPVAALHQLGYVLTADDSTVYYAPGLDMLTSSTFAEDHCLRLSTSRDNSELGLAFEPTRERRAITDIRGTLWLDRATAQLKRLEYRYTNLSPDEEHAGTGGAMEFARLRTGAWVISRWKIQMPIMERRIRTAGAGRRAMSTMPETVVLALQVDGGDLALVWRGADTLWRREPVSVSGIVADSASGKSLANARVVLLGTAASATTDGSGRFTLRGVVPGEYMLEAHTAALDSIGTAPQTRVVAADGMPLVTVLVPSSTSIVNALCGKRLGPSAAGPGIILGTARIAGVTAAPSRLKVLAAWTDPRDNSRKYLDALTGVTGNYRLCGVPVGTVLVVSASSDQGSALATTLQLTEAVRVARTELVLDPQSVASAEFAGLVMDSTGAPIAEAEVVIPALHKSLLSDAKGSFRLRDIAPGTHQVIVRKIGWGPLDVALTFGANETVEHRVILTRVSVLEQVTVTAKPNLPWMRDFEDSRKLGLGHFWTRDDLAKQEGKSIATLLGDLPAAGILRGNLGHAWLTNRRGNRGTPFAPDPADTVLGARPACYAQVYLDEMPMFLARAGEPLFDLNSLTVRSLEAIEYYEGPAQTPGKYLRLNSHCGVIVLRTRVSP
jgi:hypothetical protein